MSPICAYTWLRFARWQPLPAIGADMIMIKTIFALHLCEGYGKLAGICVTRLRTYIYRCWPFMNGIAVSNEVCDNYACLGDSADIIRVSMTLFIWYFWIWFVFYLRACKILFIKKTVKKRYLSVLMPQPKVQVIEGESK